MERDNLPALRRAIACLEGVGEPDPSRLFCLGAPSLDRELGGGLARGVLHEILGMQGLGDAAAAGGFGLGLALRAAGRQPLVWARQDFIDRETGQPYGTGLAAFGLDPGRLLLVRAQDPTGVLRAAAEAARCSAVGAVLVEIWGTPKVLDLKASRRLALAAGQSGVTLILVRLGAEPIPSAATSRWQVRSAPSVPLEANAPGPPAFALTLLRHRAGIPGRTWIVEWDCERAAFKDPAPLSRLVAPIPAGRPAAARVVESGAGIPWRRAG